jgi:hypothetical protein
VLGKEKEAHPSLRRRPARSAAEERNNPCGAITPHLIFFSHFSKQGPKKTNKTFYTLSSFTYMFVRDEPICQKLMPKAAS